MNFRPWGDINWALSLSTKKNWHFIGVLGTEERSLCSWIYLKALGLLNSQSIIQINDVDSEKYRHLTNEAIKNRRSAFEANGGNINTIYEYPLMTELFNIKNIATMPDSVDSIILDITSFPKRFFFLILKTILQNKNIKNVLLTYTSPESYVDDSLYEDIESWKNLPGFGGIEKPDYWIVSVGFLMESLRREIKENPANQIKILIPFPAPISILKRTWHSIAQLEDGFDKSRFDKHRVDTLDISAAYDEIHRIAGQKSIAFAPFGPKTTSVAMCLYSLNNPDKTSVFYPQPMIYHPNYSIGIRNNTPETAITGYWIKHEGELLYR